MNTHINISPQIQNGHAAADIAMIVQEPLRSEIDKESLQRLAIQRKLSIGSPDDPLEHEADAVADKVMRMPEPNFIQRKCAECEEEDEKLQRKANEFSRVPFIQAKLIQRMAFPPSPSQTNAEIREDEEKIIRRKVAPDIQRMEHIKGTDPSRVTATNVHPWQGRNAVGDDIYVNTDAGNAVSGWVAYGGPEADRYWCHGHTLRTYADSLYSVYSGDPIMEAVHDEYYHIPESSVQSNDIAVWIPNYDHSCIFQNVVHSAGGSLDRSQTMMSTKNGWAPLTTLSLDQVNTGYGTSTNQPAFFRHV
jgi:hypothetical protein